MYYSYVTWSASSILFIAHTKMPLDLSRKKPKTHRKLYMCECDVNEQSQAECSLTMFFHLFQPAFSITPWKSGDFTKREHTVFVFIAMLYSLREQMYIGISMDYCLLIGEHLKVIERNPKTTYWNRLIERKTVQSTHI